MTATDKNIVLIWLTLNNELVKCKYKPTGDILDVKFDIIDDELVIDDTYQYQEDLKMNDLEFISLT